MDSSDNKDVKQELAKTDTLRTFADQAGIKIGSVWNAKLQNDGPYNQIVADQFNLISSEYACKMVSIVKHGPDDYKWDNCDGALEFAQKNNQAFKFHAIFWPRVENTPDWTYNLTAKELEDWSYAYIDKIAERYGDKLDYIDVVNEMLAQKEDEYFRESAFLKIDDFSCKMFKHTKEKIPHAKLFYNDFGTEQTQVKADRVYKYVKDLHDRGCGIDMVGFQSHTTVKRATDKDELTKLRNYIQKYDKLGMKMQFTELDIKRDIGDQSKQDEAYVNMLDVCVTEPGCDAFQMWGFTDKYSWLTDLSGKVTLAPDMVFTDGSRKLGDGDADFNWMSDAIVDKGSKGLPWDHKMRP